VIKIRLLKDGYRNNENLYSDFIENKIEDNDEYFSDDVVYIKEVSNFPIYMGKGSEKYKRECFLEAFDKISSSYLEIERDKSFDGKFWHSIFCTKMREYILDKYPEIKKSEENFKKIVIKKFDWENYTYKCLLGAQYISDNIKNKVKRQKYFNLIVDNLDLYNYIIKYEIFRNDKFLLNILDIINDWGLSKILKSKIRNRDDLGKDERVGRRVIFEFNKSYPIIMSPMLEKEELEIIFIKFLSYYTEEDYYSAAI